MDISNYIYLVDYDFNGRLWEREKQVLPSHELFVKSHQNKITERWRLERFLIDRYTPITKFVLVFGVTELPDFQDYNKIFEVVNLIKDKKNIHLLFVNDYDLYDHLSWNREERFARALQLIEGDRLEFLFNNTLTVEKFKNKFPLSKVEFSSSFLGRFCEKVQPFKEYTGTRQKHFLCLNSRITGSRDDIYNKLAPMNNSYLSYRLKNIFLDEDNPWNTNQKLFFADNPELINNEGGHYAPDKDNTWEQYQDIVDEKYYTDSCVYVCTDSLFSGVGGIGPDDVHVCTHWWTEKLLKSFYYKLPVVYVGLPYVLESIRTLGFRTFNDFWSESYDWKNDPVQRMGLVKDVIDEISNYSIEQLNTLYYSSEMQEILNHNHKLLLSMSDKYKRS